MFEEKKMTQDKCYMSRNKDVSYCYWYASKFCPKNCNYANEKAISFENGIIEKSGLEKFIDNQNKKCVRRLK